MESNIGSKNTPEIQKFWRSIVLFSIHLQINILELPAIVEYSHQFKCLKIYRF